ncbi:NAD(P)-binding protein, partial [Parvibaculum sp.]|uniref:NAD(P)-binding protein n=1 Tax=Parvibaculum sp. TaxID=2024848 RepID=UPI003C70B00B
MRSLVEGTEVKSRSIHVAILGAGAAGLAMAIRLQKAGIPFTIYEKDGSVGGTWRDNT